MNKIFVTGTDTGVGKTLVSAGLCLSYSAHYWKPIQAGTERTDNEVLAQFIPKTHIHPSAFTLKNPLSPNQAAKLEGLTIEMEEINCPRSPAPLIIEGTGGALVPFNDKKDMTDLMKKFKAPVLIVARSTLGTLNHTFLTLSSLRAKQIPILGVVMIGPSHPLNKDSIEKIGKTNVLMELPFLEKISKEILLSQFKNIKSSIVFSSNSLANKE